MSSTSTEQTTRQTAHQTTHQTARRRLMTPAELAEYLGVTMYCVYAWSSHGGGPKVIHVGGRLRYRPEDVEAWLDTVTDDRGEG